MADGCSLSLESAAGNLSRYSISDTERLEWRMHGLYHNIERKILIRRFSINHDRRALRAQKTNARSRFLSSTYCFGVFVFCHVIYSVMDKFLSLATNIVLRGSMPLIAHRSASRLPLRPTREPRLSFFSPPG